MSKDPFGNFFDTSEEPSEAADSGGKTFGFVGPFTLSSQWYFWSSTDLDAAFYQDRDDVPRFQNKYQGGNSFHYGFPQESEARKAGTICSDVKFVGLEFNVACPDARDIISWSDPAIAARWENGVGGTVQVQSPIKATWNEKGWRNIVAYHFMFLPSLVQSIVSYMAMEDERYPQESIFSFAPVSALSRREYALKKASEETGEDAEPVFTDETQENLCGSMAAGWENSELFTARKKLWAALGEENYYISKWSDATEGSLLKECLRFIAFSWPAPLWLTVDNIDHPVMDAIKNSGDRVTVTCITALHNDEETAREATGINKEETEQEDGKPVLPEAWGDSGEKIFLETLSKAKENTPLLADLTKNEIRRLGVDSAEELQGWWEKA